MNPPSFSTLTLAETLQQNLLSLNYTAMTPIQAESLPLILQGKDVIAKAQTGSGKTVAFSLGLLHRLDAKKFKTQSLVLCPTRELADQVADEIRRLARAIHNIKVLTLCGGVPFGPQVGSLEHGAHIIVGTPGRIDDHLRRGTLTLKNINTFVLDEADRMLDMGFQTELDNIIEHLPSQRQTLLFSATYPDKIQAIARHTMQQPVMVEAVADTQHANITQHFYKVMDDQERMHATRLLLMEHKPTAALIFCNTKAMTQEVADTLHAYGFAALPIHGDLEQRDRDKTLARFANKSATILVATDVAARGLDIDSLDLVINYQTARDSEIHTHRIGRTGRAGADGVACTLFTEQEAYKVALLDEQIDPILDHQPLPSEYLLEQRPPQPAMTTLEIAGGKKQKLRPGDILGALTGGDGIAGEHVGKIKLFPNHAYVAVHRQSAKQALKKLNEGKLKGRSFRVRSVHY